MTEWLTQTLGSFGGIVATLLQGVSGLAVAGILFASPLVGIAAFVLMFVLYSSMGLDALIVAGVFAVIAAKLKSRFLPDKIEKQVRAFLKKQPPQKPRTQAKECRPYREPLKSEADHGCVFLQAASVAGQDMIFDLFEPGDRYYVERAGGVLDVFSHREELEYAHLLLVNMDTLGSGQYVFKQDDLLKVSLVYAPYSVGLYSREGGWCFFVDKATGKRVYAVPEWACEDALKNVDVGGVFSIIDVWGHGSYLPHFTYVTTSVRKVYTWGICGEYAQHSVVETTDRREVVVPVSRINVGDRIGYDAYTGLHKEPEEKSGNFYDKFSESWINVIQK